MTKFQKQRPIWLKEKYNDVIITDDFQLQLDEFHRLVPLGIEWSGILIYESEGDFNNLVITPYKVAITNIGTGGSTEEIWSDHMLYLYEICPEFLSPESTLKLGYIHSHHDMDASPSFEDDKDLVKQAKFFNQAYYFSMIVNYSGRFTGRAAYVAELENTFIVGDNEFYQNSEEVVYSESVFHFENLYEDRINELKKLMPKTNELYKKIPRNVMV